MFFFSLSALLFAQPQYLLLNKTDVLSERTEVRYHCPAGSVITGLGARAHADNITTLWVYHRPLLPDGSLGPEEEIHLGSEPDHACEALVHLPDPYVACGFGARGAPEWDVTTLCVWARPLQGGTLGKVEIFRAGFLPDHGLERQARDCTDNRVLCGVGLRFHSNDIAGIWARSAEIFRYEGKPLRLKGILFKREPLPEARKLLLSLFSRTPVSTHVDPPREAEQPGAFLPCWKWALEPRFSWSPPTRPQELFLDLGEEKFIARNLPFFPWQRATYLLLSAAQHETPLYLCLNRGEGLRHTSPLLLPFLLLAKELSEATISDLQKIPEAWAKKTFGTAWPPALRFLRTTADVWQHATSLQGKPFLKNGRLPSDALTGFTGKKLLDLVRAIRESHHTLLPRIHATLKPLQEAEQPVTAILLEQGAALLQAVRFLDAAKEAWVLSRCYTIDGASRTRTEADQAFARFKTLLNAAAGFCEISDFSRNVTKALNLPQEHTQLGERFAAIEKAERSGHHDTACAHLASLLQDTELLPFLKRRYRTISQLLTSLSCLWEKLHEAVPLLWGGDGRFCLLKRHGRWAPCTCPRGPVIYFDWQGRLPSASDVKVSFSYFDGPPNTIFIDYDSAFTGRLEESYYRRVVAARTQGSAHWLRGEAVLPRAVFLGRQNWGADFRFIGQSLGIAVRDVYVTVKESGGH